MPVFNGARFLGRAIDSLLAQTYPDWELLAVDDGSTDDSAHLLECRAERDYRIRVFRLSANGGPAAARNVGLKHARGEFIAYLDCDDEYYPKHLEEARAAQDRADVLLFPYDLVDDRAGQPGHGNRGTYDPASRSQFMFSETISVPLGVIHRRSLYDRFGGFDETLWKDEDGDLWRRYARPGVRFMGVPHKSGLYHIRGDSLARTGPPPRPGAAS
jgi:glycosyltransferase involved in cell wall biosynthesis